MYEPTPDGFVTLLPPTVTVFVPEATVSPAQTVRIALSSPAPVLVLKVTWLDVASHVSVRFIPVAERLAKTKLWIPLKASPAGSKVILIVLVEVTAALDVYVIVCVAVSLGAELDSVSLTLVRDAASALKPPP